MKAIPLKGQLDRLIERTQTLPACPERDDVLRRLETTREHWPHLGRERQLSQMAGHACFVGELEHQARLDLLIRDGKLVRENRSKGGKASTVKMTEWHAEAVRYAKSCLFTGYEKHELAGVLAKKYGVSAKQVREVLIAGGVLQRRAAKKKTEVG